MRWHENMLAQITQMVRFLSLRGASFARRWKGTQKANELPSVVAAKAALRRKKAHERSLEQTEQQIGTLEQQVNAIESANINRDTLSAVEKASDAMKGIHGKLTVDKVEQIMYVLFPDKPLDIFWEIC